ncbi:hypothetical protein A3I27_01640 [Candidatus Giovannonibacteria bacterium RIFCSPLOWO2_02_FULL_43_11b]|uniref:Uncharacterized protein n=1 Tax=Candidatus Giovannonibacteria bacterium RIFCSPHIGHO2_12_FULL_43_15 TaxID=1798341 RepID=A0A1F5WP18_9BACT|nr:MAG: hypothetical protein A2739_01115 [Candidatus Giovannonibacteria bacterium RIFCSPHIGHO2_01_FULL_43_100]OGF66458.1 MAG: hypothetical protein A3B97_03915 [Candidatus Giovannonibacteria bacterium RIFCSPHIGHO2_02_FULL_43_32]OGF77403.1 MAG: hypothetical protein A3F23_03700 [Candidatus Giovannonibacteria bacterium RIFCSPHIGHO2_12_FULL_43_15]OGF78429.1 MAG: hypothetical protein A3A15_03490 [Candidatus Giovannonibacteria bacterium RIFCSPLOWO2_01_FULL_43_60]OGF89788.1 MAG: hypothetical protein A3
MPPTCVGGFLLAFNNLGGGKKMANDLKIALPAEDDVIRRIQYWKFQIKQHQEKDPEFVWRMHPFAFGNFTTQWDYRFIFKQYRSQVDQFDGHKLVLFPVLFEPKDNLVTARQFLLTLAKEQIPVVAKFPDKEFANNLCDLVVHEIE